MPIFKYDILNPVKDNKRPFFDEKRGLFYIPVKTNYRYYIEAAITNAENGGREYYILLSNIKFDENCRLCNVDGYGRCKIKVKGELKDYIIQESSYRGNIDVTYMETEDVYDVYLIE